MRNYRPGQQPVIIGDESEGGVAVEQEIGFLNQADVDRVMDEHVQTLIGCYDRAGDARRYASGKVVLKFLVSRTGAVTDVLVTGNRLGNYAVERCLVVEGRRIPFPAPEGNATDFEYSLDFRSSEEARVLEWPPSSVERELSASASALAACGSPGETEVFAVAYVQPGGTVTSVGLASDGRLDVTAAMCVVEQIRKWRLANESSHIARTTFSLSGGGAVEEERPRSKRRPPPSGRGRRARG